MFSLYFNIYSQLLCAKKDIRAARYNLYIYTSQAWISRMAALAVSTAQEKKETDFMPTIFYRLKLGEMMSAYVHEYSLLSVSPSHAVDTVSGLKLASSSKTLRCIRDSYIQLFARYAVALRTLRHSLAQPLAYPLSRSAATLIRT